VSPAGPPTGRPAGDLAAPGRVARPPRGRPAVPTGRRRSRSGN